MKKLVNLFVKEIAKITRTTVPNHGQSSTELTQAETIERSDGEPASQKRKVESKLAQDEIQVYLEFVDDRNYNVLMLAIEQKDEDLIDTLIELDFDLAQCGSDGKRSVDLAIDNKMFDVFVKLIEADSPFPVDFRMNKIPKQSNASEKLRNVNKERSEFHDFVMTGDMESLKSKILQDFKLKFAYDMTNKSALTYAIEEEQFAVFSFLQSKGFSKGIDPFYEKAFDALTEDENNSIANFNLEYFKTFTSEHVNLLVTKTKIASHVPDRSKSYEEIWKFYNDLDAIPEVAEVLNVVSRSERLKISFDFESLNVHKMHPAQPRNAGGAYYEGGYIYIGAGKWESDRNEVLGLIAHELTHCAMKKVYKNKCKPYRKDNEEREQEFKQIVERSETIVKYENVPEEIFSSVYDCYQEVYFPSELIVRVPHLLAKYNGDGAKIKDLERKFDELFRFFRTKTLPDLSEHCRFVEQAKQAKTLNDEAGLLQSIIREEIQFEVNPAETFLEQMIENQIYVVLSGSSILTLSAFIDALDAQQVPHISMDSRFFAKKRTEVLKLYESAPNMFLLIKFSYKIDDCQTNFGEVVKLLDEIPANRAIMIVESKERNYISRTIDGKQINVSELSFTLNELSKTCQKRILQRTIEFQEKSFKLERFFETNNCSSALNFLPLEEIVEGKKLKVNKIAINQEFFFERKLFLDEEEVFSLKDVIARVIQESVAVISGIAGTGKTSVLRGIFKKVLEMFPFRWVSFIDLKEFVSFFETDCQSKTFVEHALELVAKDKSEFERKLFEQLYENGKVSLFLDGFDEISPHYKKTVSEFLTKFKPGIGNQLWITTRSHLEVDLEKLLSVTSYQLSDFDDGEQIEFLRGCLQNNVESAELDSKLGTKLSSFVKSFKAIMCLEENFIGIPMLLKIIAESCNSREGNALALSNDSDTDANVDLYCLYEEFVERYFFIWRHDKGTLSVKDQTRIENSKDSALAVHQKISMKFLLRWEIKRFEFDVDYDEKVWTSETLARIGLVRVVHGYPHFLHRSFAEFFSAQHIVLSLQNPKRRSQALKILFEVLKDERIILCHFLDLAVRNYEIDDSCFAKIDSDLRKHLEGKQYWRRIFTFISKNNINGGLFRIMMKIARQVLTDKKIKLILQEKDWRGMNIVEKTFKFSDCKLLQEVLSVLSDWLSTEEIGELFLHSNNKYGHWFNRAAASASLSAMHGLNGTKRIVLNEEDQKKFLKMRDSDGRNIFLNASRNHDEEVLSFLVDIARQTLGDDEIKSMLKEKDDEGMNIVEIAWDIGGEKKLREVLSALSKSLRTEEIGELFLISDSYSYKNHWFIRAASESLSTLQSLNGTKRIVLNEEDQKNFWKMRKSDGRNIFLQASTNHSHEEVLSFLIDIAKQTLGDGEIKSMLKEKNERGKNIVELAWDIGGEKKLLEVLSALGKSLRTEEIGELFLISDSYKNHWFIRAASESLSTLQRLDGIMRIVLNKKNQKNFWKMRGSDGRNIFLQASTNHRYEKVLPDLIDIAKKTLGGDEIKSMLKEKDEEGKKIVELAWDFGREVILQKVLSVLTNWLSFEEIGELFLHINNMNGHWFNNAAASEPLETLQSLNGIMRIFLNEEDQKKFIKLRGSHGRNIFLQASTNHIHEKVLSFLIDIAKQTFGGDEIKSMLQEKDERGMDIVELAWDIGREKKSREVLSVLSNWFSTEEIVELFPNRANLLPVRINLLGNQISRVFRRVLRFFRRTYILMRLQA